MVVGKGETVTVGVLVGVWVLVVVGGSGVSLGDRVAVDGAAVAVGGIGVSVAVGGIGVSVGAVVAVTVESWWMAISFGAGDAGSVSVAAGSTARVGIAVGMGEAVHALTSSRARHSNEAALTNRRSR